MIRSALPAVLVLVLAACGSEPDAPAPPIAEEGRVLSDAAEMLPADTPSTVEGAPGESAEAR